MTLTQADKNNLAKLIVESDGLAKLLAENKALQSRLDRVTAELTLLAIHKVDGWSISRCWICKAEAVAGKTLHHKLECVLSPTAEQTLRTGINTDDLIAQLVEGTSPLREAEQTATPAPELHTPGTYEACTKCGFGPAFWEECGFKGCPVRIKQDQR